MRGFGTYGIAVAGGNLVSGGWWGAGVNWAWDAIGGKFAKAFSPVAQASALTFTRASSAYSTEDTIVWTAAATDVLRETDQGVLLEPAATNMLIRTAELTNAAWTKSGTATVEEMTSMPAPAPGYGNWFKVNRGSEAANAILVSQNTQADMTIGKDYVVSAYFMAEGSDIGKLLQLEGKRGTGGTYTGNTVFLRLTAQPQMTDTWFTPIAGNLKGALVIHAGNTDLPTSFYVSLPQFEEGKEPTSPIRSDAAPGVRAADAATLLLPAAGSIKLKFGGKRPVRAKEKYKLADGILRQFFQAPDAPWAISKSYRTSSVLEYEVRPGDKCFEDDAAKNRAEIMTGTRFPLNTDIWNADAIYIDEGFAATLDPQGWAIFGQWHGDASDGRSPYVSFNMIGNDLVVYRRIVQGGGASGPIEMARVVNVPRRKWINRVIRHKVHATAGLLQVWLDGVLVVDYTGPLGYWDHAQAGYWHEGVYCSVHTQIIKARYQNREEGTADLSARITAPLALNVGEQAVAVTPGSYALAASVLKHPLVDSIMIRSVIRPSNEYITFAGDSRTANGFDITTGRHYLESRGEAGWAQAYSGNRFKVRRPHYGVGGDTSADLLARWSTVLADAAGSIRLLIGANDRGSANLTLQQSIDNVTAMIRQARAAGKVIFLDNEMPYNALTGQQRINHFEFHNWLTLAPTLFDNVYGVDTWSVTVDPASVAAGTYQWLAGLAPDGLHQNVEGGKVMGMAVAQVISAVLPAVDYSTPWVSGESVPNPALNLNPGMTGTGGTKGTTGSVTGSVADNWRGDFAASDTSGVCVCSKETIGGIEYQVFTFSGTVGSTGTFTFRPLAEQTFNGLPFDMRAKVILGAGSSNLLAVSVEGRSNGTVTQQSRTLDGYVSPDLAPAGGFDLNLWAPPCAEAASPTAKRGDIVVQFVPSSVVSGVVKIASAAARQVA